MLTDANQDELSANGTASEQSRYDCDVFMYMLNSVFVVFEHVMFMYVWRRTDAWTREIKLN